MSKRQLTPEQLREREQISKQCQAWLKAQMDRTGWNVPKIEEASGVHRNNIYRVLNDDRSKMNAPPTFSRDTILKLAKAFSSSETGALAAIGLVQSDASDNNLNARKAGELIVKLPLERQAEALDQLQYLVSKHGKQKAAKRLVGEAGNSRSKKTAKR